jgi:carbon storage regulator
MLVITRKVGQVLYIGDNIKVVIVRVGNGVAQIGVEAPRDVTILREEAKLKNEQATTGQDEEISVPLN